jgi:hypothetical protein
MTVWKALGDVTPWNIFELKRDEQTSESDDYVSRASWFILREYWACCLFDYKKKDAMGARSKQDMYTKFCLKYFVKQGM